MDSIQPFEREGRTTGFVREWNGGFAGREQGRQRIHGTYLMLMDEGVETICVDLLRLNP